MHEWMLDNNLTPHIVVDAIAPGVDVPQQHVAEGKIILNISYSATDGLDLNSDPLFFKTRFSGISYDITVPVFTADEATYADLAAAESAVLAPDGSITAG